MKGKGRGTCDKAERIEEGRHDFSLCACVCVCEDDKQGSEESRIMREEAKEAKVAEEGEYEQGLVVGFFRFLFFLSPSRRRIWDLWSHFSGKGCPLLFLSFFYCGALEWLGFFVFWFIIGNWVTGSGPSYLWVVGLVSAHGLRGDFSMLADCVGSVLAFGSALLIICSKLPRK